MGEMKRTMRIKLDDETATVLEAMAIVNGKSENECAQELLREWIESKSKLEGEL